MSLGATFLNGTPDTFITAQELAGTVELLEAAQRGEWSILPTDTFRQDAEVRGLLSPAH